MSAAVRTSAPDADDLPPTLSEPIASEVSAFFTANVPPNPQHWSASQVDQRQAIDGREQSSRSIADAEDPHEWQVGWNATGWGNVAPTSVTPRTSTRNSVSS